MIALAPGNPMRTVLLSILVFEAVVFGLAVPVMVLVSQVPAGVAGWFGGAAAVLALVGAALLRRPVGYAVGWLTQAVGVALGFVTPAMFLIGALFAGLWVLTFILGIRLERQQRAS